MIDPHLGKRKLMWRVGRTEYRNRQDAHDAPPDDRSWRYRTTGAPRAFAVLGVVLGLAAGVVPGLLALRSYRRWREGVSLEPMAAWILAAVLSWLGVVVGVSATTGLDAYLAMASILVVPGLMVAFARR